MTISASHIFIVIQATDSIFPRNVSLEKSQVEFKLGLIIDRRTEHLMLSVIYQKWLNFKKTDQKAKRVFFFYLAVAYLLAYFLEIVSLHEEDDSLIEEDATVELQADKPQGNSTSFLS